MRDKQPSRQRFLKKSAAMVGLAASSRCRSRPRPMLLPETHADEEPSKPAIGASSSLTVEFLLPAIFSSTRSRLESRSAIHEIGSAVRS